MTLSRRLESDRGAALLVVLLMLTLSLALVSAFTSTLVSDQQLRGVDQSRTRVFYAAHGALEQLTADLGNLFVSNFAPTSADVRALTVNEPAFERVVFDDPGGTGYTIDFPEVDGSPVAENRQVMSGPFQGFTGLLTPYRLSVTARSAEATTLSSEVRLERTLQTVAIPLFQFGVFSETDLSFFAGPNFNFGGRVHTNGNLFLASGGGSTLQMADRVTAVGEVIRTDLSNGFPTNAEYPGTVSIARAPNVFRTLDEDEGSLVGTLGSAQREPGWTDMSITDYNGYLRNGRTGARRLDLPFVTLGATPIDLIRRGVPAEEPLVLAQRYYTLASMRILLSDTAADLTVLPGVTADAPVALDAAAVFNGIPMAASGGNPTGNQVRTTAQVNRPGTATNPVDIPVNDGNNRLSSRPHILINNIMYRCSLNKVAGGVGGATHTLRGCIAPAGVQNPNIPNGSQVVTSYRSPVATPLVGGVIKIEIQRADRTWVDVTGEILALGVSGRNLAGAACAEPSPDAVIRLQRLRDDPANGAGAAATLNRCGTGSTVATDYWPNALYDTREGNLRDSAAAANDIRLNGVMHYVEVDVNNLRRYFAGDIGASGTTARSVNGYTVYFSDRRTNRNAANAETGELGSEDFVNPASGAGTPNNVLDQGEDINLNGALDRYGRTPRPVANSTAPLDAAATPETLAGNPAIAKSNRPVFFRRTVKLVNGSLDNLPMPGFTLVAENPVYVQGHYNADAAVGFDNVRNSAAAIIADAVTLLSINWNDNTSFANPNVPGNRDAVTTWYRMAILSGKGRSFDQPNGTPQDFGTDGGVHNFLRYLENWGGQTLNYRGSIASLYFNRQAVGPYKCCTTVYSPPTRGYTFDVEFLQPALLPPFTPMFRDVNTTGFTQVIQ